MYNEEHRTRSLRMKVQRQHLISNKTLRKEKKRKERKKKDNTVMKATKI